LTVDGRRLEPDAVALIVRALSRLRRNLLVLVVVFFVAVPVSWFAGMGGRVLAGAFVVLGGLLLRLVLKNRVELSPLYLAATHHPQQLESVLFVPSAFIHAPPEKVRELARTLDVIAQVTVEGLPRAVPVRMSTGEAEKFIAALLACRPDLDIRWATQGGEVFKVERTGPMPPA
jgi:hypothetical protein